MKVVEQCVVAVYWPSVRLIERGARICYRSQDKMGSDDGFIERLIRNGHETPLEHATISVGLVTSRDIMAELTRHRLASFSVESTRYNKYRELECISPWIDNKSRRYGIWMKAMREAEKAYQELLEDATPEYARSVLPNSLAVRIFMSANVREWRHILKLRLDSAAHPNMRRLMAMIITSFHSITDGRKLFGDIHAKHRAFIEETYAIQPQ